MVEGAVNHLYNKLKTTELENEEIVVKLKPVEKVMSRGKNCMLVRLLSSKYYNREAFKSTMKKIWHPVKPLQFFELGEGLLMVEFEDYNNKWPVMHDGPWSFDKCLILMKDFEGE